MSPFSQKTGTKELGLWVQELRAMGFAGALDLDFPLSSLVYYQIGGPTDFLLRPKNEEDVLYALKFLKSKKLPLQIIGGGTNVLIRDGGLRGAVLYLGAGLEGDWKIMKETSDELFLRVPAHWSKARLLFASLKLKCAGLEFSAGIPGTRGGAVWMNAGTKWGSYSDVIQSVRFVHPEKGIFEKNLSELGLKYRGHGEGLLDHETAILSVDIKLLKNKSPADSRKLVDEIPAYRGARQPLEFPNCGSVFKNPQNSEKGSGRLIEAAELKGKQIGQAMISPKHANFILNLGAAKSSDVEALIRLCQEKVLEKFKISLEPEVIILGQA